MPPAPRRPAPLLVRAARGEAVERPPVWAMRQAGRWDPEFNRVRAGLSFYEFSENVELAARASLLPRRFGVDANLSNIAPDDVLGVETLRLGLRSDTLGIER